MLFPVNTAYVSTQNSSIDRRTETYSRALKNIENNPFSSSDDSAEDQLVLSERGKALNRVTGEKDPQVAQERLPGESNTEPGQQTSAFELSEEEQKQIDELKKRDREVRAHEQAHMAAGGGLVQGPYYEYTTGPDGKQYATAGSVSIDTAPVPDDPQQTISKMQTVKRAALAPINPSPQDRRVAQQAAVTEARARAALLQAQQQELSSINENLRQNRGSTTVESTTVSARPENPDSNSNTEISTFDLANIRNSARDQANEIDFTVNVPKVSRLEKLLASLPPEPVFKLSA